MKDDKNNNVNRDIMNDIEPIQTQLKNINNTVYGTNLVDDEIDIKSANDEFVDLFSTIYKQTEEGFSGDLMGALFNHYKANGTEQDMKAFNVLKNGLSGEGDTINNGLMSLAYMGYTTNIQKYKDIKLVVKMIPQLQEAIESMADSILASDNVNNLISFKATTEALNRIEDIDQKYDFAEELRVSIINGLTYGYSYAAVIPYKEAFKNIKMSNARYRKAYEQKNNKNNAYADLFTSDKLSKNMKQNLKESIDVENILNESGLNVEADHIDSINQNLTKFLDNITINEDISKLMEADDTTIGRTLANKGKDKLTILKKKKEAKKKQKEKCIDATTKDGFISDNDKIDLSDDNITGCLVKQLDVERLIPIRVDETNIGFYYFEDSRILENVQMTTSDPMMLLNTMQANGEKTSELERANGEFFRKLSDILTNSLIKDKKFLKDNQKFKEQIYSIIKYGDMLNKSLRITYIPAEQVIEFGNGKSMIDRSLFYAKLYLALLLTNIMIKISRGYDKRLYLVKGSVPAELSASTTAAIREIKKDSRSITMLSNVNKILNMAGQTQDIFIPVDSAGNKAIDYDVMAGQDVTIKDELLELLEDRMLSGTGVPTPLIQASTDVDFAKSLHMLNSKFLRRTLTYQRTFNYPTNLFFNKINAADYGLKIEDDEYEIVDIKYLPPAALGVAAMNEQVGNSKDLVDILVRTYTDSGTYGDDVVSRFTLKLMKKFCPLIPWDELDTLFDESLEEINIVKKELAMNGDNADASGGGSY